MVPVIGVCSSARESNVSALLTRLRRIPGVTFRFVQLPYNDIGSYRLRQARMRFDGAILCHSIHNRRFALTNVVDALYDNFLPHAIQEVGKENMAVIAHDFRWPMTGDMGEEFQPTASHEQNKRDLLNSFQVKQQTTFECSALAMVCGRLDDRVEMDDEDWKLLETFVTGVQLRTKGLIPLLWKAMYLIIVGFFYCGQKALYTGVSLIQFFASWGFTLSLVPLALLPLTLWMYYHLHGDRKGALESDGDASVRPWYVVEWWQAPFTFWPYCVKSYTTRMVRWVTGTR